MDLIKGLKFLCFLGSFYKSLLNFFYTSTWSVPTNISLVDQQCNWSGRKYLLPGVKFHHQLLLIGQIQLFRQLLLIKNSVLGWVFSGKIKLLATVAAACGFCTEQMRPQLSAIDRICKTNFTQNITKNEGDRFMVRLPFNELAPPGVNLKTSHSTDFIN